MKINEVIERHGMRLRDVSREMGLKPSALQSAIDRNLTVKTLRLISEAAKIPIAEFFLDELTDEERRSMLEALRSDHSSASEEQEKPQDGEGGASDLPFSSEPSATSQQAIICPHCHQALVFNIASYEQK